VDKSDVPPQRYRSTIPGRPPLPDRVTDASTSGPVAYQISCEVIPR
jgi:hypothetical protein